MGFCTQDILTLASGIYADLNSPSTLSVGYISGVLTSSGFLGDLNNRLSLGLWISSGSCIEGGFGADESNIASLLYQFNYVRQEGLRAMQNGGLFWQTMGEGDSRVTRANPVQVAAEWRAMRRELEETLHTAIANWTSAHILTVSVDAASLSSVPVV